MTVETFACHHCGAPTALYIETPGGERVGVCWAYYHGAEIAAVNGRMPSRPLRAPGAVEAFASDPVPVAWAPLRTQSSATLDDVLRLLLLVDAPLGGEEIAERIGVAWAIVSYRVRYAADQGYVTQHLGAYSLTYAGRNRARRRGG